MGARVRVAARVAGRSAPACTNGVQFFSTSARVSPPPSTRSGHTPAWPGLGSGSGSGSGWSSGSGSSPRARGRDKGGRQYGGGLAYRIVGGKAHLPQPHRVIAAVAVAVAVAVAAAVGSKLE